jgi:hypothetical protein
MEKILQRVQQVLHTGQTKFYGQVKAVRKKALLKANEWLREPEVKLSGNVFKANKGEETVTQVEFKKD